MSRNLLFTCSAVCWACCRSNSGAARAQPWSRALLAWLLLLSLEPVIESGSLGIWKFGLALGKDPDVVNMIARQYSEEAHEATKGLKQLPSPLDGATSVAHLGEYLPGPQSMSTRALIADASKARSSRSNFAVETLSFSAAM